tara:strand:- start:216 stop:815 length:600 start_codon:yes stop_codon:yes gene_type:complete
MSRITFLPDPLYNPENQELITSRTEIAPGITIAKFLGAYGDRTSFNHIEFEYQRREISRNLVAQAESMRLIINNSNFSDIRLIVSEGLYRNLVIEFPLSDVLEKKRKGQLIYYQVVDKYGDIDLKRTFDVAEFLKDNAKYKKLILDYDTYDPDGKLTAQIGLEYPQIDETFTVDNIPFDIETIFNNQLMTKDELIEILE